MNFNCFHGSNAIWHRQDTLIAVKELKSYADEWIKRDNVHTVSCTNILRQDFQFKRWFINPLRSCDCNYSFLCSQHSLFTSSLRSRSSEVFSSEFLINPEEVLHRHCTCCNICSVIVVLLNHTIMCYISITD